MGQAIRPAQAALVALALAASVRAATPASPSATADFSGGGRSETITARAKGKVVRLEARDDSGKRIARADAPAPDGGRFDVVTLDGSIGSAGTLLEVAASRGETICRSVWRLRDSALSRLPLRTTGATLPDCDSEGWTSHWDETRNEPARYVRERTRGRVAGHASRDPGLLVRRFRPPARPEEVLGRDQRRFDPGMERGDALPEAGARRTVRPVPAVGARSRAPPATRSGSRTGRPSTFGCSTARERCVLPVTGSKPVERADPGVDLTAAAPGGEPRRGARDGRRRDRRRRTRPSRAPADSTEATPRSSAGTSGRSSSFRARSRRSPRNSCRAHGRPTATNGS
jgi:hypothetical protein